MKTRISILFIAISCLLLPVHGSAQKQEAPKKPGTKEISQLIDSIAFSLKRYYIYPEKAAVIEKALRANLKSGAYKAATSPQQLAEAMQVDIRKVHYDGHMRLMYAPELEKEILTPLP